MQDLAFLSIIVILSTFLWMYKNQLISESKLKKYGLLIVGITIILIAYILKPTMLIFILIIKNILIPAVTNLFNSGFEILKLTLPIVLITIILMIASLCLKIRNLNNNR